jgi:hypothetical protein
MGEPIEERSGHPARSSRPGVQIAIDYPGGSVARVAGLPEEWGADTRPPGERQLPNQQQTNQQETIQHLNKISKAYSNRDIDFHSKLRLLALDALVMFVALHTKTHGRLSFMTDNHMHHTLWNEVRQ